MTLRTREILAKDLPVDVFVYLPAEKRFFFIDDLDVEEDSVTLYFEANGPLDEEIIELPLNKKCRVVEQYTVSPETLFD